MDVIVLLALTTLNLALLLRYENIDGALCTYAHSMIASIMEGITASVPYPSIISALYSLTTWLVNTLNLGLDKSARNCNGKKNKKQQPRSSRRDSVDYRRNVHESERLRRHGCRMLGLVGSRKRLAVHLSTPECCSLNVQRRRLSSI